MRRQLVAQAALGGAVVACLRQPSRQLTLQLVDLLLLPHDDPGVGFDRTKAQGVGTVAEFTLDPAPAAG